MSTRRRRAGAYKPQGRQPKFTDDRGGVASIVKALFFSLLLVVAAALAGFLAFVESLPERPVNTTVKTDAIVVLTGGSERVATGIRLLEQGLAKHLFISGVPPDVTRDEVLRGIDLEGFRLRHRIVLGHAAGDTAGNARETAAWMERQQYRSLRLVTSQYHMPRSRAIFAWAMPDVEIVPHPVFSEAVRQGDWWVWPGTTKLFLVEYAKYVAAAAYVWLVPAPEPA